MTQSRLAVILLSAALAACGAEPVAVDPPRLAVSWQMQSVQPGPYDEPRYALTLSMTGAIREEIPLGTYSGSFNDSPSLIPDAASGALLTGMSWWAGAGDQFLVRAGEGTLSVLHRVVDEAEEQPGVFEPLQERQIPANAQLETGIVGTK